MSGLSNLPPGVTGNEWEIAGYPPCGHMGCGHPAEDHGEDGCLIGVTIIAFDECECEEYTPYSDHDEYEPDLEAGT